MKDLVDVIPFLQAYEPWVRWLVLVWLLLSAALVGVLVLATRTTPPTPAVAIDALRVPPDRASGPLILDLLVRNPLPGAAQLVELQLAFFADKKPSGGLQSYSSESATYVLAAGPGADDLLAGPEQGGPRYPVEIGYPYAGQDYVEVKIPLSQSLKKDETDRFVIRFDTDQLPGSSHRQVEARIRYNGDALTQPRIAAIP